MNRKLLVLVATAFAAFNISSCSEKAASDITGIALNDSTGDASLIVSATVTLAQSSIEVGQTTQATAVLLDRRNRPLLLRVNWTSSNSAVATVSASGLVTAVSPGSASIIATRGTKSGSATLTVVAPVVTTAAVASISVAPATSSLEVGATVQLLVTARDANDSVLTGRVVTSSSADPGIASVNTLGLVTAVSVGNTQITVTSEGKSAIATITVTAATTPPPPATAPGTVSDLAVSSIASTSVTLSFTQVNDGTGQPASYDVRYAVAPISWGSAVSTTSGTCTTPIAGTAIGARITCTVLGLSPSTNYNFQLVAFRGTLNVSVVFGALSNIVSASTTAQTPPPPVPVASVTVAPATATVSIGQTQQLTATLRDANNNVLTGRTVTWASNNTAVATVSGSGLVSAVAAGSATITATSGGVGGTSSITVPTAPPPGGGPVVFSDDFETGSLSKWDEFHSATQQVINNPTLAHSGNSFMRMTYGINGEDGWWLNKYFTQGFTRLYVKVWIRFSTNFSGATKLISLRGSPIGQPQQGVGRAGICPSGRDAFSANLVTELTGADAYPQKMYTYWQDMWPDPNGQCWGRYGPTSSTWTSVYVTPMPMFTKGTWHLVEFAVKMNSGATVADGEQKFWVDGVKYGEWKNIRWGDPAFVNLGVLQINGSDLNPTSKTLDFDDLVLMYDYPTQ